MAKNVILAEAIYNLCNPKQFSVWEGCNQEPKYLARHMAATDLNVLNSLITGNMPTLKATNIAEEITYVTIGYPKCWKTDKKLYFIRDSEEIDLPD